MENGSPAQDNWQADFTTLQWYSENDGLAKEFGTGDVDLELLQQVPDPDPVLFVYNGICETNYFNTFWHKHTRF